MGYNENASQEYGLEPSDDWKTPWEGGVKAETAGGVEVSQSSGGGLLEGGVGGGWIIGGR